MIIDSITIIKYIVICILAYGLGNFATSFIVGKLSAGIDIRKHGSGNAGATNTFRVLGLKMGAVVFLGDALKGALAVLIGYLIAGENGKYIAGAFAVIGHIWPIALGFKGGKGVATTIGVMLAASPLYVLMIAPFGITLLVISRYVSLSSVLGMIAMPTLMIIRGEGIVQISFALVVSSISIFAHRNNIVKLVKGTESRIDFMKKKSSKENN